MAAVDLNRATATELEQLPGVGPVTAANIVGWRDQHGPFAAVSELQQVDGIGPKTYARIAPHVRV
jgi:competence protein ComEA